MDVDGVGKQSDGNEDVECEQLLAGERGVSKCGEAALPSHDSTTKQTEDVNTDSLANGRGYVNTDSFANGRGERLVRVLSSEAPPAALPNPLACFAFTPSLSTHERAGGEGWKGMLERAGLQAALGSSSSQVHGHPHPHAHSTHTYGSTTTTTSSNGNRLQRPRQRRALDRGVTEFGPEMMLDAQCAQYRAHHWSGRAQQQQQHQQLQQRGSPQRAQQQAVAAGGQEALLSQPSAAKIANLRKVPGRGVGVCACGWGCVGVGVGVGVGVSGVWVWVWMWVWVWVR